MEKTQMTALTETPLAVTAQISRVVTKLIDQNSGNRVEVPLMVASAVHEALKLHGIRSQVYYGQAAWIEVLKDHSLIWSGLWGQYFHFWTATQFGEIVDLTVSKASRKLAKGQESNPPLYSPPMLWSKEVPGFYKYQPEGLAELELTDPTEIAAYARLIEQIKIKCAPNLIEARDVRPTDFANEAIVCNSRRILDDSYESFKHLDRVLSIKGIPEPPKFEHKHVH